jgi:hypothetical protein
MLNWNWYCPREDADKYEGSEKSITGERTNKDPVVAVLRTPP